MKKYYILEAITNNDEDIYNKVDFAIFDSKEKLETEKRLLIENKIFSEDDLDSEMVELDDPKCSSFLVYYRFNASLLESIINFDNRTELKRKFEDNFKMDTMNSCSIRYKSNTAYEIWTEESVIIGRIKRIRINGGIEY